MKIAPAWNPHSLPAPRTGASLDTMIVNFWTFEDGWPIKLTEYHDIERIQAFSKHLTEIIPSMQMPDR